MEDKMHTINIRTLFLDILGELSIDEIIENKCLIERSEKVLKMFNKKGVIK
jgi:hypothetical protein